MPYGATRKFVENHKQTHSKTINVLLENETGEKRKAREITYEQYHPD